MFEIVLFCLSRLKHLSWKCSGEDFIFQIYLIYYRIILFWGNEQRTKIKHRKFICCILIDKWLLKVTLHCEMYYLLFFLQRLHGRNTMDLTFKLTVLLFILCNNAKLQYLVLVKFPMLNSQKYISLSSCYRTSRATLLFIEIYKSDLQWARHVTVSKLL
jgi:hypothetical protein